MRSERDLYALWERTALAGRSFDCSTGERITIISAGCRNTGPGPDYPGAVLLIDGRLRSGAVEMHLREDDWFAHGHQNDPAYETVILHLLETSPAVTRLNLPTADIAGLTRETGPTAASVERAGDLQVTPDLLLELSWERMLRRTTRILRQAGPTGGDGLRQVLVQLLFDGLGYSGNRIGMRRVAARILEDESLLCAGSFEQIAAALFRVAGLDREELRQVGRAFIPDSRLDRILPDSHSEVSSDWRGGTRPANAPARRIWGGAKLLFDIYQGNLMERLTTAIRSGRSFDDVSSLLRVRLGSEVVIGRDRALEMALNAVLPVTLAFGLREDDIPLIEGSCRLYRNAPALGSNRHLQIFRQRYGLDMSRRGAFWQQGGIELVQRYLTDDRSGLSFVAEGISSLLADGTSSQNAPHPELVEG